MSLYARVQDFYARQMRLLDEGKAEEFAETFTEDGVFAQTTSDPRHGRDAIAIAFRKAIDRRDGPRRRHWLGMLSVDEEADGTIRTRYYALVIEGRRLHLSTSAEDELIDREGALLVRSRTVSHDDD
ncbi:SgcJ/EcaC family oxidoreductase [Actinomadura gamaensis]|uniref:SgcJ/EcaC family oxidoreductase n=1 Tax=Actinomadura gamaensis TaxID=1763541 RepID=A0ABV9TYJ2_9ACTN